MPEALQAWVAGDHERDDDGSCAAHRRLFDGHAGERLERTGGGGGSVGDPRPRCPADVLSWRVMRITLGVPQPWEAAVDALASRLGISRAALARRALQELLAEHEAGGITAALDAVYKDRSVPKGRAPTLARMQFASLPREDW